MELIYTRDFYVGTPDTDRWGRLKLSHVMDFVQEVATDHAGRMGASGTDLIGHGLFWAVIRHRVRITRLPRAGENIRLETWPLPATRTAYPRSVVAYDRAGNELFRAMSLWVLMDVETRGMVLPGKSGLHIEGLIRGSELELPGSLAPRSAGDADIRTVRFTDLDINGHMNNCRYLDWIQDTLPGVFHQTHVPEEFSVCYLSEAREGERVQLKWALSDGPCLDVDACREEDAPSAGHSRVFIARLRFRNADGD